MLVSAHNVATRSSERSWGESCCSNVAGAQHYCKHSKWKKSPTMVLRAAKPPTRAATAFSNVAKSGAQVRVRKMMRAQMLTQLTHTAAVLRSQSVAAACGAKEQQAVRHCHQPGCQVLSRAGTRAVCWLAGWLYSLLALDAPCCAAAGGGEGAAAARKTCGVCGADSSLGQALPVCAAQTQASAARGARSEGCASQRWGTALSHKPA